MTAAAWEAHAACTTADPEIFSTAAGVATVRPAAARYCRACPVTRHCLDKAMRAEGKAAAAFRFGIFGGLSPVQRHALYLDRRRLTGATA